MYLKENLLNARREITILRSLFALMSLSGATSGCFIGNQVVAQPSSDPFSGYYLTEPQSLTFYVTTSSTLQKEAATHFIPAQSGNFSPAQLGNFITNPVAFILNDAASGDASITSPAALNSGSGPVPALPIYLNTDNTLEFQGSSSPTTYWKDPACQTFIEITESGTLQQTQNLTPPPGNTHHLLGKIQLKVEFVRKFVGNCTATFQTISDCYADATQCTGDKAAQSPAVQQEILNTIDLLVKADALNPKEIPSMSNFAYQVLYQ